MRKSRFTEAQNIGMIKEQEAGMPTVEVCCKHSLSQGTLYKLKSKYEGVEVLLCLLKTSSFEVRVFG